jgi:hypothetical protein
VRDDGKGTKEAHPRFGSCGGAAAKAGAEGGAAWYSPAPQLTPTLEDHGLAHVQTAAATVANTAAPNVHGINAPTQPEEDLLHLLGDMDENHAVV